MLVVFDIETYPNCFTLSAEHAALPIHWCFEISDFRDDSKELLEWVDTLTGMVGYNNVAFDYPVLHTLLRGGKATAATLYAKAMAIIGSYDHGEDMWQHTVYPSDRVVPQLDLYKIHHFDNRAKATSLKSLEFSMRLDSIQDLPIPVGTVLTREQVEVLKRYNAHDVAATKRFYQESLPMIKFRQELSQKYGRDFLNHNDTKIGKDYFAMRLEAAGVQLYNYGKKGRTPIQTPRPVIRLKDAILPWIEFQTPEFQKVIDFLRTQEVTETKGVFKGLTAKVDVLEYVFGLGGIHGSVSNRVIHENDNRMILDLDVTSMYPSIAIEQGFYPEHLGEKFCEVYADLKRDRVKYAKGSPENAMLKLALNGVYGDSNNKFSIFYDPLFTMKITLNGQLMLCLLIEQLREINSVNVIQCNTDGVTVTSDRDDEELIKDVCDAWTKKTGLVLESAYYRTIAIADVNSYIGVYRDGKTKRKGRYEYDVEWHQDASALVVPMVAEKVLVDELPIEKTLREHKDLMDFMLRIKVPRGSRLEYADEHGVQIVQNTTRYYVSQGGGTLTKVMPPLAGKTEERRFAVQRGWTVCVCNEMNKAVLPVDYRYYINEVEKLTLGMRDA